MKKIELLLGSFTFLDEQLDGVNKTIIHKIDKVIFCNTPHEAEEKGENELSSFESYLIPELYNGKVEYDPS